MLYMLSVIFFRDVLTCVIRTWNLEEYKEKIAE